MQDALCRKLDKVINAECFPTWKKDMFACTSIGMSLFDVKIMFKCSTQHSMYNLGSVMFFFE